MHTRQIIEASATVTTIVEFAKGSVYKRVDESAYSGPKLLFGVVTDVMHNGTDAAFTALEYSAETFGAVEISQRVFTASKEVALFKATPDEFRAYLTDLVTNADRKVREAEKALREAIARRDIVMRLQDDARVDGGLSEPTVVIGELVAAEPATDADS